jgi:predicted kinase
MSQIKIIFTRGIQASGKSYWAKDFVKKNQDYKRVCRDDLRHMISSYTFNDKNEKLITEIEEEIINSLINCHYNVIIDSMNLNKQKLEQRIIKYKSYWLEYDVELECEIKNFPITFEEAITRDKLRSFVIGEKVIKQTWHKYKNELIEMLEEKYNKKISYNTLLPDAVCFDVDGTLSFRNGRSPYDLTKVDQDLPNKIIFEQMNFHFLQGRTIFIFSGRENICFEQTENWINKHKLNPDINFYLHMREKDDNRRDSIVKKELYEKHIKGKYNLIAVYDDRPQVINECWRELGIFTFDVGKGIEF